MTTKLFTNIILIHNTEGKHKQKEGVNKALTDTASVLYSSGILSGRNKSINTGHISSCMSSAKQVFKMKNNRNAREKLATELWSIKSG